MSSANSLPKTYKAAMVKEAKKPFEIVDVELKQPEHGQILVKGLFLARLSLARPAPKSTLTEAHTLLCRSPRFWRLPL